MNYNEAFSAAWGRVGQEAVMLYVCADRTLTYAPFGSSKAKIIPVALPVGTVADSNEAEMVITMIGSKSYGFADGDKSYLDRAAKVKPLGGGPASRVHYSLPDFQFNNQQTVVNVMEMVCDVRDSLRAGDRDSMTRAFAGAHEREGRFFTEDAATVTA